MFPKGKGRRKGKEKETYLDGEKGGREKGGRRVIYSNIRDDDGATTTLSHPMTVYNFALLDTRIRQFFYFKNLNPVASGLVLQLISYWWNCIYNFNLFNAIEARFRP